MKDIQGILFKGELMEELLRTYFLNLGYFVVRGVKLKYENFDITDVDLYLYGRASSLVRQRINVDIKNKKSPQAFERILWANGLKQLLNFDKCIVATSDFRTAIQTYGKLHDTIILDGTFLNKLKKNDINVRLTEEELLSRLSQFRSDKTYNQDWRAIYEDSKTKLLSELDFSGLNNSLLRLRYFIEKSITDTQSRELTTRMLYLQLSHTLIIADYILKDLAFLEQSTKEKQLIEGLKFGNLGKVGVDKIIEMAISISGKKASESIYNQIDNIPTEILKEFFGRNEIAKNLFSWARDFESFGYNRTLTSIPMLESTHKGLVAVFLDYFSINRTSFFEAHNLKQL